ncbi:hypothetical protein [Sphingomonas sp. CFBP 8760]|uniref:hypothetical protein n=1 Tax=Sphingomonas sp. CFBP 8760 TaxID=2775282 RepID=UPI00177FAF10|nr:hypothetical protein [Sphingomonas sp. CFBP 8760]MBD8548995.1 hypothetical protein [Sphingomonas sp. CFBP 8760]
MAYCVAHTGKSLLWAASDLLTLYLLVSRYGMAPAIAGALFLTGLAASALADFAIGAWLARRPGDAARIAAVGLCVASLVFPLTIVSAPLGPGAVLAAALVFRISYAGCDVPHNALMGRLGGDPAHATALSRGRTLGTGIASFVAAACLGGIGGVGITPLLWGIGAAATLLGMAMVPLLITFPLATRGARIGRSPSGALPWAFLLASVVGIVALGSLGKAMLHLSGVATPAAGATTLGALIAGRTASALFPVRIGSTRQGLSLLAVTFCVSAAVPILFLDDGYRAVAPLVLGLAMGLSNLIGWALLSLLARDARDYGFYTMASKLALGAAGLALAGGLGGGAVFTPGGFPAFAGGIWAACVVAALLCLTCRPRRDLDRP